MVHRIRLTAFATVLLLNAALLAACSSDEGSRNVSAFSEVTAVERQVLQSGPPPGSQQQDLQLTRVIIPGGQDIAAHTHPGLQLAVIVEGRLTYTVLEGTAQVIRAAGTPRAQSETVAAGKSIDLNPGDSVMETPGMVHTARNAGDVPVVIYLSSLFPQGAPASSPVEGGR